jgi:hypothetical protein
MRMAKPALAPRFLGLHAILEMVEDVIETDSVITDHIPVLPVLQKTGSII